MRAPAPASWIASALTDSRSGAGDDGHFILEHRWFSAFS
jgi:hypothetical protein